MEFFRNFDQNSNGKDRKYPSLITFTECVFDLSSEYLKLYYYFIFLLDSSGKSATWKSSTLVLHIAWHVVCTAKKTQQYAFLIRSLTLELLT